MLGAWEQALQSLGKPGCGNPTRSPLPRMDHRMPETQLPPRGLCESGTTPAPPRPSPSLAGPQSSVGQLWRGVPSPALGCPAYSNIILAIVPLTPSPLPFSGPLYNGAFAASSTQGGDELTQVFPSLKIAPPIPPPPSHPPPLPPPGVSGAHLSPRYISFLLPWVRCKGHG